MTVTVKVTSDLEGQTFANSAVVSVQDDETGQEKTVTTNEVSNTVLEEALKAVLSENGKKDLSGETVDAGTVLQYQITVKNPSEEEKVFTITDVLPEGTTFVSADNDGICEDGTASWSLTLSGGESKTVALFVSVDEDAAGGFVQNTAQVAVDNTEISTNMVKTYVDALEGTDSESEGDDTSDDDSSDNTADSSTETTGSTSDGSSTGSSTGSGSTTASTDGPKTGDNSNVLLWALIAGLAGASALAFGGYAWYRRKKED
ncbi:MAG: DUF11 domain-containing protein [Clostridiales bacterium]|nr:DUF11 domain-containing protein [Clostridiales bacterium]